MRSVELLINQLEALHQPVILALANKGIMVSELVPALRKIHAPARAAKLGRLRRRKVRGRPQKLVANAIARILASNYKTLTGKAAKVATDWDTGVAYGAYLRLVRDVFKALKVNANPEHTARNATRRKRRKIAQKD